MIKFSDKMSFCHELLFLYFTYHTLVVYSMRRYSNMYMYFTWVNVKYYWKVIVKPKYLRQKKIFIAIDYIKWNHPIIYNYIINIIFFYIEKFVFDIL
jgi:hypothetical protein